MNWNVQPYSFDLSLPTSFYLNITEYAGNNTRTNYFNISSTPDPIPENNATTCPTSSSTECLTNSSTACPTSNSTAASTATSSDQSKMVVVGLGIGLGIPLPLALVSIVFLNRSRKISNSITQGGDCTDGKFSAGEAQDAIAYVSYEYAPKFGQVYEISGLGEVHEVPATMHQS